MTRPQPTPPQPTPQAQAIDAYLASPLGLGVAWPIERALRAMPLDASELTSHRLHEARLLLEVFAAREHLQRAEAALDAHRQRAPALLG